MLSLKDNDISINYELKMKKKKIDYDWKINMKPSWNWYNKVPLSDETLGPVTQ